MSNDTQLDDIDRKIVDLLQEDGRMPNRVIAAAVGLSDAAASARIRRLTNGNPCRVTALCDIASFGYDHLVVIGVTVAGRSIREVAADLARIDEVVSLSLVLGRYHLMMSMLAADRHHVQTLLDEKVAAVAGVASLDAHLTLDVLLYESQKATITT